ncbi:MAG: type II toxin-antitoxin system ParD family antitoxin [Candidatus Tumulicola sp.]
MKELDVSIPDSLKSFVERKVETGTYTSASEVARDGLILLQENEKRLSELREAIRIGIESGDGILLDDISVEEIARRGMERLRAGNA